MSAVKSSRNARVVIALVCAAAGSASACDDARPPSTPQAVAGNAPPPPLDLTPPFDAGLYEHDTCWSTRANSLGVAPHAHVTLHGNIAVYNIRYGAVRDAQDIDAFSAVIANGASSYLGRLSEYANTSGVHFAGSIDAPYDPPPVVTKPDLDQLLGALIPSQLPADSNAAYVIYLSPGIEIDYIDAGLQTVRTCGLGGNAQAFHWRQRRPDLTLHFAVIADLACSTDSQSANATHELVETITNPEFPAGWYNDPDNAQGGGEIADICLGSCTYPGYDFDVACVWSNARDRCTANF